MNLVDLTLVIFVALTVFVGIKRGFLISLLSALRFIIAVPLSLFVGNNYNVIIYNKVVRRYILEYVCPHLLLIQAEKNSLYKAHHLYFC